MTETEKTIEKIAAAPAVVLDKGIETSQKTLKGIKESRLVKKPLSYWDNLGPGLTTGASDDDPSGIATYSQTGAAYGYQLLWLSWFTFPLMAIVQEMCARLGLVTGRGLAGNIRRHYPKWVLYVCTGLLFAANSFNIGADLGAMAKATQLLTNKFNYFDLIIGFTVMSLAFQIFVPYGLFAKYLKYLALVLLAYVASAVIAQPELRQLATNAVMPTITFSRDQIILICAILGTTISPYLFFWQTSQEVEEEILQGKTTLEQRRSSTTDGDVTKMRIDVWSGMFLSNLVMFFIIAACAATLYANGIFEVKTAEEAAAALEPFAGKQASLLFTVGIIGTGLLAIPVLAGSASYAISESFGWKSGLHKKLKQASPFYGIIIFSMLVGLLLNFVGFDPIKALIYSALANGFVAPIILVLIVLMSSNKKIMGERTNHPAISIVGWVTVIVMAISGLAAVYALFI